LQALVASSLFGAVLRRRGFARSPASQTSCEFLPSLLLSRLAFSSRHIVSLNLIELLISRAFELFLQRANQQLLFFLLSLALLSVTPAAVRPVTSKLQAFWVALFLFPPLNLQLSLPFCVTLLATITPLTSPEPMV